MKLSFLFSFLCILGGTLMRAQLPANCSYGTWDSYTHACYCHEGYARSDPKNNCSGTLSRDNKTVIFNLFSTSPCDTSCDWKHLEDPFANYSCITEENRICDLVTYCGHGIFLIHYENAYYCQCDEGYAASNPKCNCIDALVDPSENKTTICYFRYISLRYFA
jgi:hypothetical protein